MRRDCGDRPFTLQQLGTGAEDGNYMAVETGDKHVRFYTANARHRQHRD